MPKSLTSAIEAAASFTRRPLRAVIYARVSTEEQARGYGIAAGEKRAKRYIEKQGWMYVTTFADEGVSGSLPWPERPHLKRLMELAGSTPCPFDVVVVPEGRVIGRVDRAYYPWVWKLDDIGVFVADAKLRIDTTTDEGRDKMREEANYAFKEYTRIKTRTQSGVQEKAEEGGYTGGFVPFGYRVEDMGKKKHSRLVPDSCDRADCTERHELPTAKRGRELFVLHKNWSTAAALLNAEGLFTRSGKPWSDANLRHVLTGDALLNSRQIFRRADRSKLDRDGRPLYGDQVVIELPPAFTDEEKAELRHAIKIAAKGPALNRGRIYPVSERVICPCGGRYTGWSPTGKRNPKYRCNKGMHKCPLLPAEPLEKYIWSRFQAALGDIDRLKRVAADWIASSEDRDVNYEQRLAELDTKIERQRKAISITRTVAISEALERGLTEAEAVGEATRAVRPLNKELAELERLRQEVAEWQTETAETSARSRDLVTLAVSAQQRLGALPLEKQARLFALLDTTVTITGPVPRGKSGVRCTLVEWFRERDLAVPDLTDEGWAAIADLVSGRRGNNPRVVVEGLLHKARTGSSWLELPKRFGDGPNLRRVFHQWKDGIWPEIIKRLEGAPSTEPFNPSPLPPMSIRTWVIPELLIDSDVHLLEPASRPA
ncbi:recombinase family protein [Streptomyces sp. Act-28]